MGKKVIEVDLERIHPNLRLIFHSESIEWMCRLIQSCGQIQPIEVWLEGEGFRIWDGEKRWRACKILGISRVKALLVEFN